MIDPTPTFPQFECGHPIPLFFQSSGNPNELCRSCHLTLIKSCIQESWGKKDKELTENDENLNLSWKMIDQAELGGHEEFVAELYNDMQLLSLDGADMYYELGKFAKNLLGLWEGKWGPATADEKADWSHWARASFIDFPWGQSGYLPMEVSFDGPCAVIYHINGFVQDKDM